MSVWRRRERQAGGPWPGPSRRAPVVELAEPDSAWKRIAWEELGELWRLLEPWCPGGVHHVGSTAVPEVPARPVIDLWAGLADAAQAPAAAAAVEAAGWRREPAVASRASGDADGAAAGPAYACTRGDGLVVAVELLAAGGAKWNAGLLLRDRLRAQQGLRCEYARVKRRAAARAASRDEYERRKAAFIQRVLEA